MSEPFLGEVRTFGFNFAPRGWAFCNGQLLPISQNTALFSLLGTQYGGDGIQTFALPDLRGRVGIHQGSGPGLSPYAIGQTGGTETVTLTSNEMPAHNHSVNASG
ncbi:MAG: tail fiber protein, partial [Actinomycetota bacterium]|nr:tail fiber protein [Actinomycetota bacterium]